MNRALFDPRFTRLERRWAASLETVLWLLGTALLLTLMSWSSETTVFG